MEIDRIQGDWEEIRGKVKQHWGKLTDDDIALFNGSRQEFVGKIQEAYGITKEEAQKELIDFEETHDCIMC